MTLDTPRLTLTPCTVAFARAVLAGAAPVPAAPGWPHADTLDALRPYAEHGADDVPGPWLVTERSSGLLIGECGWYGPPGDDGTVEIGYGLAAPSRGRGYGTEAVRALVGWVAAQPGVRRVVADVEVGNVPSRRLLERLGFAVAGSHGALVTYAYEPPGPPGA
ncbi:MAG TPA: GNAT family N-acetyltransferase [Mycobacteriales bacterium]|nr:GNAT family N-acetyltransferase [Mycobacteriales bacterium]